MAEQAADQRLTLFSIPGIPQRDQARQGLDTHLELVFDLFLLAGELLPGGTLLLALLQYTVVLGLLHVAIPEETACRLDAPLAARQRFLFLRFGGRWLLGRRALHLDGMLDHVLKDVLPHVHQVQEPPDIVLDLVTGDGAIRAAASLRAIPMPVTTILAGLAPELAAPLGTIVLQGALLAMGAVQQPIQGVSPRCELHPGVARPISALTGHTSDLQQ